MAEITIRECRSDELTKSLDDLADVLHAAVHAGASVGFILPHALEDSRRFWQDMIFPSVKTGGRVLLLALAGKRIVGTAQLVIDLLPNQAHRGEVSKLLVHPDFRRQGIARSLMAALETRARELGKTLLTLDTRTGDTAELLYHSLGFQTAGTIPGYCRAPDTDTLDATTYMYKTL